MVVLTFLFAVLQGLFTPLGIYVNEHIFNDGLKVASGEMQFSSYAVFLVLFVIMAVLPSLIGNLFTYGYVEPRSLLILRTAYKSRMLQKIKTMKYEHFENEESMEIIDKAYNRAENSARHLWPMYVTWTMSSMVASIGVITYLLSIKWWLLLTVLIPFVLQTYISNKNNYNIYEELETYWNKERQYHILGGYLRSREYSKEMKLFGSADYMIDTYKDRLNKRNKEYEKYYFKHLRRRLLGDNVTKFAPIVNVILLLVLFINGQITCRTLYCYIFASVRRSVQFFSRQYDNLHRKRLSYKICG